MTTDPRFKQCLKLLTTATLQKGLLSYFVAESSEENSFFVFVK